MREQKARKQNTRIKKWCSDDVQTTRVFCVLFVLFIGCCVQIRWDLLIEHTILYNTKNRIYFVWATLQSNVKHLSLWQYIKY